MNGRMRWAALSLAIPSLALTVAGCGSGDSTAVAGGLPDYCQQVTGDVLKNITDDVRGTPDKTSVYAVRAETAPDYGTFATSGLYFIAVPTKVSDAFAAQQGKPVSYVPILVGPGSWVKNETGGLRFPADNVSKAYFRNLGTEVEPSGVMGYDANQEAADQARECVEKSRAMTQVDR